MIAFLLIVYTAVVLVLFKLKLVRPNPYPIACMVVAGVLIIGGVAVAWMLCAPLSPKAVTTQYVVQLVPYVKGQVTKVYAQPNQPIKKGDLLLEINPAPYQYASDQAQAQLQAAQEGVKQAQAGLQAAQANVVRASAAITQAQAAVSQARAAVANAQAALSKAKAAVANAQATVAKAKAADDLAKTEEQIALSLQRMDAGAISTLRVTQARQNRQAADAALTQAETGVGEAQAAQQQAEAGVRQADAAQQQAEAGLAEARAAQQQAEAAERQAAFGVKMAESKVPAAQAQLDDARFNLAQCRMVAPTDGYVVDWQVQDGTMLVPMPMAPAGTFISTSETFIAAVFPQNYLVNVKPGNEVELVLDPYPGRLFKGEVDTVITATGEGQFTTGGKIPYAAKIGSVGVLAVKIRLTGDNYPANLPLGAGGTVAIYTDRGKPVHIISKVAIRMKKWLLYVLPTVEKPS
jgi:multidrug resistance efflux pump